MLKWLLIAGAIFGLDQITKIYALQYLELHTAVTIMPGVNLALAYNEGAAFSMLADHSGWQQILFISSAILISIAIVVWLYFLSTTRKIEGLALTCILGGALGNLLDRICYGHVVDFIDIYYGSWHWYTFNIADVFISIGAFLLILSTCIVNRASA